MATTRRKREGPESMKPEAKEEAATTEAEPREVLTFRGDKTTAAKEEGETVTLAAMATKPTEVREEKETVTLAAMATKPTEVREEKEIVTLAATVIDQAAAKEETETTVEKEEGSAPMALMRTKPLAEKVAEILSQVVHPSRVQSVQKESVPRNQSTIT
jgi:hypothetical protein